ncbi:MAG: hypothetical protein ACLT76_03085 [Clostridium fessum]
MEEKWKTAFFGPKYDILAINKQKTATGRSGSMRFIKGCPWLYFWKFQIDDYKYS